MKILLLLLLPFLIPTSCAYAEDDINDGVSEILDGIDFSDYNDFLQDLREDSSSTQTIEEIIREILNGKSDWDAAYFLEKALSVLTGNIGEYLTDGIMILIVCVLLNVLKNISSGLSRQATEKIVYAACYGVVLTIVLHVCKTTIQECSQTVTNLEKFTAVVFPPLFTVLSGLGGTISVSVYQPVVSVFSGMGIHLIEKIVFPLFYVHFAMSLLGNLSPEIKFRSFLKTIKSVVSWLLGIFFGLFLTITTAKGITGSGIDSLALRGAKYALSGYVPIVGSYLKDGFDIVTASCIVIKNALGFGSVGILLLFTLSPILKIAIVRFTLKITSSFCESLDGGISQSLSDVADSLQILLAAVLCCIFSLFALLLLILCSCNLGVL